MKIRPVGVELSTADGRTDGHDEAKSRCSKFCQSASKIKNWKITNHRSVCQNPGLLIQKWNAYEIQWEMIQNEHADLPSLLVTTRTARLNTDNVAIVPHSA